MFAQSGAKNALVIGPGDLLHIQVFNTPELEQHPRVLDDGEVPLEFIGNVHLAGLTPDEAAHEVEQRLISGKFVRQPQVTVVVDQFATQNVSVLGEVHLPGSYQLSAPRSVIDVLAMAGGITNLADRNITIKRQSSEKEKVSYFLSNDPNAAFDQSVLVYPGDAVLVEKAGLVYILGDVRNPGGYVLDDNQSRLTALQIIAHAGGLNKTAVASHVRLIRKTPDGGYSESSLQLSKIEKGKTPDINLMAGDVIYVPFSYAKGIGLGASGIAASVAGAAVRP
jgi:polysaccharide export outer membrane protein